MRTSFIKRKTKETDITLKLNLDGKGESVYWIPGISYGTDHYRLSDAEEAGLGCGAGEWVCKSKEKREKYLLKHSGEKEIKILIELFEKTLKFEGEK